MSWSYRKNLIGKVRIYYSSGCVGPVQIPLDELADELNDYEACIAELEAENDILENQLREATNFLIDKKLHVDSLYEDGFKLQKRIAELEAAQRWIPVSERLPEEDTDSNALMAICRYSGEWVRTAFGAEFADEFVRHYTHWMYAPQPPEVQQ